MATGSYRLWIQLVVAETINRSAIFLITVNLPQALHFEEGFVMTSGRFTTIRLTEIDPHVIVLSMNRPEQRNAINVQMAEELEACLFSLKDRQNLRALIITGEGTAFGAGADLKERAALSVGQTRKARSMKLQGS